MAYARKIRARLDADDKASPVFMRVGNAVKTLGAIAVAVGAIQLGGALVGGLKSAVAAGAEFESKLSTVAAVSGATAAELGRLEKQALLLGRSTAYSAAQSVDAQINFAKAGFQVKEIMDALPGSLDLAAAGELELAAASSITSNAIRAFNLDASKATDVADLLAKTANSANTTVGNLGEAFKYVAPAAGVAGIDITEVSAALSILADRGIDASMAGTSLRKVITTLLGEMDPTAEGFDQLSASMFNADGTIKSLAVALEVLQDEGFQATESFKRFGERAGNAMAILAKLGPEALKEKTADLLDRAGYAAEVAEAKLDNLKGAMVRLDSATTGLKITIGKAFQETLKIALDEVITPTIVDIDDMVGSTDTLRRAMLLAGAAVLDLTAAFVELTDTPFFRAVIGWAITEVGEFVYKLETLGAALGLTGESSNEFAQRLREGAAAMRAAAEAGPAAGDNAAKVNRELERLAALQELLKPENFDVDISDYEAWALARVTPIVSTMGTVPVKMSEAVNAFVEHGDIAFGYLKHQLGDVEIQVEKLGKTISRSLRRWGVQSALELGDALINAAMSGKDAFKQFAQAAMVELARVIVKALILKAIMAAMFEKGGIVGGAFAQGGIVGAQAGYMVPGVPMGRDTVPIMASPGEAVIPAWLVAELRNQAGVAGPVRVEVNIDGGLEPAIEQINVRVRDGSARLLASEVVTSRNRR